MMLKNCSECNNRDSYRRSFFGGAVLCGICYRKYLEKAKNLNELEESLKSMRKIDAGVPQ
jgi:hypothetical protein